METSNEYVLDFTGFFGRNNRVTFLAPSLLEAQAKAAELLEGRLLSSAILECKNNNRRWSWDFTNKKLLPMKVGEIAHDAE